LNGPCKNTRLTGIRDLRGADAPAGGATFLDDVER